jgi:hypothetical protein
VLHDCLGIRHPLRAANVLLLERQPELQEHIHDEHEVDEAVDQEEPTQPSRGWRRRDKADLKGCDQCNVEQRQCRNQVPVSYLWGGSWVQHPARGSGPALVFVGYHERDDSAPLLRSLRRVFCFACRRHRMYFCFVCILADGALDLSISTLLHRGCATEKMHCENTTPRLS